MIPRNVPGHGFGPGRPFALCTVMTVFVTMAELERNSTVDICFTVSTPFGSGCWVLIMEGGRLRTKEFHAIQKFSHDLLPVNVHGSSNEATARFPIPAYHKLLHVAV